jgi:hypothetical protein
MLVENLWLLLIGLSGSPSFNHKTGKEKPRRRKYMKPLMMLIGATVVLLAFIQAQSLAQEKYVPTADEEIYGTWTNKDHFPQKVVTGPDGYKAYNFMSDSAPIEEGTVTIDSKWTDQDGNVWYKTFGTVTYGTYKGSTYQELH